MTIKIKKHSAKTLELLFENLLLQILDVHSTIARHKMIKKENEMMLKNLDSLPIELKESVLKLKESMPTELEIYDNILSELEYLILPHYLPYERKMIYKEKSYEILEE